MTSKEGILCAIRMSIRKSVLKLKCTEKVNGQKHHIIQSMLRKGNCYDNCIMETFFGRLKNEMFYGHKKEYTSFEEFSKAMDEYIRYYNNERIQAKTNWMPPVKYGKVSSSCA